MADIQNAMNSKNMVALGLAMKEAERLNVDEVRLAGLLCLSYGLPCFSVVDVVVLILCNGFVAGCWSCGSRPGSSVGFL